MGGGTRHNACSGLPLARLSPTAIVARVVAMSESMPIGIGPPVLTASTNCSISARWPLSWPPRALVAALPRLDQTVAVLKLSNCAFRPLPVASTVSFGKRLLPPVR
jgi:hypothetical protein